jgi:hypothetical protein
MQAHAGKPYDGQTKGELRHRFTIEAMIGHIKPTARLARNQHQGRPWQRDPRAPVRRRAQPAPDPALPGQASSRPAPSDHRARPTPRPKIDFFRADHLAAVPNRIVEPGIPPLSEAFSNPRRAGGAVANRFIEILTSARVLVVRMNSCEGRHSAPLRPTSTQEKNVPNRETGGPRGTVVKHSQCEISKAQYNISSDGLVENS